MAADDRHAHRRPRGVIGLVGRRHGHRGRRPRPPARLGLEGRRRAQDRLPAPGGPAARVGLAIYVFGARPKVVAVAAAGRAAALPFERFGDRADAVAEATPGHRRPVAAHHHRQLRETVARPLRATGSLPGPPQRRSPAAGPAAGATAAPEQLLRRPRRPDRRRRGHVLRARRHDRARVRDRRRRRASGTRTGPEIRIPSGDRPLLQPPAAHLPRRGAAGRAAGHRQPPPPGRPVALPVQPVPTGGHRPGPARPGPGRAPGGDLLAGDLPPEARDRGPHRRHRRRRPPPRWRRSPPGG